MSSVATHRLIDAAAALEPADRALLNLWIHRSLDDDQLAQLTGMDVVAVQARRDRVVAALGAQLGLPRDDVRAALRQLEPEATPPALEDAAPAPAANGREPASDATPAPTPAPVPPVDAPVDTPPPAAPVDAPAAAAIAQPTSRRRHLRVWAALIGAAAVAAIVVVVIFTSSGGSAHRTSSTAAAGTPTQAPTAPTTTAPPTGAPHALAALPGGPAGASGTVALIRDGASLTLKLRVSKLPSLRRGHYEVWLYDSVLDSQPLGRLSPVRQATSYRLPGDARRYRFIDVSYQPPGVVDHSGESRLRAANPADASAATTPGGGG